MSRLPDPPCPLAYFPPETIPGKRERLPDLHALRRKYLPPGALLPVKSLSHPVPVTQRIPVGGPAEDARAAAVQAGFDAVTEYNSANGEHSDDVEEYDEANIMWNQRRDVIFAANQQHFDDCLSALESAYMNLDNADDALILAFGEIGDGDTLVATGDGQQNMMAKIASYNAAKAKYEASVTHSGQAKANHGPFQTNLAAAMAILNLYG